MDIKLGAIYIRESTEKQDKGFSPDNQERMIREYATKHNIKIVEVYKDLLSGASAEKRIDFLRMINDAEKHNFDIILVYHTSRFARNIKEARQYKTLLREKLKIDVESVTQPMGDWRKPSAFLQEGINELFDAYYSKQLSAWMRDSLAEKKKQGYQCGNPPFGYYKKKVGYDEEMGRPIYEKKWLINKSASVWVKFIHERYATGNYSMADICKILNDKGVRTLKGNPFTYSSVKENLCNKVYLGDIGSRRSGYLDIKGKHPPIIPQELYNKALGILQERRGNFGRPVAQHRFYLLQGMLYCYSCVLKAKKDKLQLKLEPKMYCETHLWDKREGYFYGCKFKRENQGCSQSDVNCTVIDKQVLKLMESLELPEDVIKKTLDKLRDLFKGSKIKNIDLDTLSRLKKQKEKLNFIFMNTEQLTHQEYLDKLQGIDTQLEKFKSLDKIPIAKQSQKQYFLKLAETFLKDFKKFWNLKGLDNEERRAWIKMAIKKIWVKDERVIGIEPRDDFKPLFVSLKKVIGQSPSATPYHSFRSGTGPSQQFYRFCGGIFD